MKTIIALWLCLLMSASQAQSRPWTDEEKLLGATALTLHAIDTAQTSYGMKHGYRELNPILGSHPSDDKLAAFFVLSTLGSFYILDTYEEDRKIGLYWMIGVKSIVVGRHIGMGLKVRF